GKAQIFNLGVGGLHFGDDAEVGVGHQEVVGVLHQPAAAHALHVERVAAVAQWHLQQSHVLLGGEYGHGLRGVFGRKHHFDELLADRFGGGDVDGAVEGNDAAER